MAFMEAKLEVRLLKMVGNEKRPFEQALAFCSYQTGRLERVINKIRDMIVCWASILL